MAGVTSHRLDVSISSCMPEFKSFVFWRYLSTSWTKDNTPLRVHSKLGTANRRRRSMKWITRANVKVDRAACPWLIRTFIDRDAEFLFVPVEQVETTARKNGAIPYDIAGV